MNPENLPEYPNEQTELEYDPAQGESAPAFSTRRIVFTLVAAALGAGLGTGFAATYERLAKPDAGTTVATVSNPDTHPAAPAKPAAAPELPAKAPVAPEQSAKALAVATQPIAKVVEVAAHTATAPTVKPAPAPVEHMVEAVYKPVRSSNRLMPTRTVAASRPAIHREASRLSIRMVRRSPAPAAMLVRVSEPAIPSPSPSFTVEGDVTVAGYDAFVGMIATREGLIFLVDRSVGQSDASLLEDSPGSLHYVCDQAGSCTLVHRGISFSAAKIPGGPRADELREVISRAAA